jgi:hypothetical protein
MVGEMSDTPRTVAAELDLAAIGIEISHTEIAFIRMLDKKQSIGSNAGSPPASISHKSAFFIVSDAIAHAVIQNHEIVAATVNFYKWYFQDIPPLHDRDRRNTKSMNTYLYYAYFYRLSQVNISVFFIRKKQIKNRRA